MIRLFTLRAYPQCVDVAAIRRIASVEDDRLKTRMLREQVVWMQLLVMKYKVVQI
jgi:hypothetical protein